MKPRVIATVLFLTSVLFLSSGLVCYAQNPVPPFCFTNEATAFTNGQAVLAALKIGDAQSKKQVQALIGSRVWFPFLAYGNASIYYVDYHENISLEVEVNPPQELPKIMTYSGECVGILKAVDFEKRVIHIKIQRKDWVIGAVTADP
jgi:hypothetical protein